MVTNVAVGVRQPAWMPFHAGAGMVLHLLATPLCTHDRSQLEAPRYPVDAFAQLSSARWGIETNCAPLQTTMGLKV